MFDQKKRPHFLSRGNYRKIAKLYFTNHFKSLKRKLNYLKKEIEIEKKSQNFQK